MSDVALFACALAAGLALTTVLVPLFFILVPVGLVSAWFRRRHLADEMAP